MSRTMPNADEMRREKKVTAQRLVLVKAELSAILQKDYLMTGSTTSKRSLKESSSKHQEYVRKEQKAARRT